MKEFKLFILSCFAIICVALFGSVFTSCSNDDNLLLAGDPQTEQVSSLDQDSVKAVTRASSLNDFSYGAYSIDSIYKDEYYHINQFDQSQTSTYYSWPGGIYDPGNCSWCNYVMAVGCVGRASGTLGSEVYDLDKARKLKNFMKTSRGTYLEGAVMKWIYQDYGLVYDNSSRVGLSYRTTGKSSYYHNTIALELLNHLATYKTPIVIIGTKNGVGHYFTVVSIVWYGNLTNSVIWVADSSDSNGTTGMGFNAAKNAGAIYPIYLKTFLNNLSSGSNNDYTQCNMLFTYDLNG